MRNDHEMKRYTLVAPSLLLLSMVFGASLSRAQGTYTAASCNQSDVNAVINGPTHTAVNGDIIIIPTGSCTWTSGVTVPSNIGIQIIGGGSSATPTNSSSNYLPDPSCLTTVITDSSSSGMFTMTPQYGNATTRISCIDFAPGSGYSYPVVWVSGSCTSSGCPNFRFDNTTWGNFTGGDDLNIFDDVFGVADHNENGTQAVLTNSDFTSWQGLGYNGDNSWQQPDTFGTNQAFYFENNTIDNNGGAMNDTTHFPYGGSRIVCRFNQGYIGQNGFCYMHGTETGSRSRGGRQAEMYGNVLTCAYSGGCDAAGSFRSGVVRSFGNNFTTTDTLNSYVKFFLERLYRETQWGLASGAGAYDQNASGSSVHTDTISSYSSPTLNLSTGGLTSGAYNFSASSPGSTYYVVVDTSNGTQAGISSNTASGLTLSWTNTGFNGSVQFNSGDGIQIMASKMYDGGTATGGSATSLTDSSKSWTPNAFVGDMIFDVTQYLSCQITSNTSTVLTCSNGPYTGSFASGDAFAILQVVVPLDMPGVSGGNMGYSQNNPPTVQQTIDPEYEWDDGGGAPGAVVGSQSSLIPYYAESSYTQTAQTSATSPFNGTSGVGWGPSGYRPTTCTTGVGYWATDVGSWNQSSNTYQGGYSQGELFVCTSTNTWSLNYTPYTYPHPIIAGGGTTSNSPAAPTSLSATVQSVQ